MHSVMEPIVKNKLKRAVIPTRCELTPVNDAQAITSSAFQCSSPQIILVLPNMQQNALVSFIDSHFRFHLLMFTASGIPHWHPTQKVFT
jgi:hypothetical protein